jgi:hypothetical protein
MPPWKPTGGLPLAHDRRLPAAEIATPSPPRRTSRVSVCEGPHDSR